MSALCTLINDRMSITAYTAPYSHTHTYTHPSHTHTRNSRGELAANANAPEKLQLALLMAIPLQLANYCRAEIATILKGNAILLCALVINEKQEK